MPNVINASGLQVATQDELVTQFTSDFETIYGADIDLDSDTPDGQLMMIFIQAVLDLEDLLVQINSMFDPDLAIGTILDQRVAINGIQRQAGTYTVQPVEVVLSQVATFYGEDQDANTPYTVEDSAGNQYALQTTQNNVQPGTYTWNFVAVQPGPVQSALNTITIPVSVVLGVTSVNNSSTYTTLGIAEESDAALKVRRQKSVSLASQGFYAGLLAALENISGVTSAFVNENDTSTTNGDGVPGHSIWVIVGGTGAASDIANAIYTKRNAGCGMYGAQSYTITQLDGTSFQVFWDNVVAENLFIAVYTTSLNGTALPNLAAIRAQLPSLYVPGVNQEVNINQLTTYIQSIDSNTMGTFSGSGTPSTGGFSTSSGGSYTNTLSPSVKNKQFILTSADIILLPMILAPYNHLTGNPIQIATSTAQQFTGLGGYGTLTYAFVTNNSGGTINSSSGLYTSGTTGSVTDTISVTDGLGNTAQAVISVV